MRICTNSQLAVHRPSDHRPLNHQFVIFTTNIKATMSFVSLPLPNIAEWPETNLSQTDRPASAPPAPHLEADDVNAEDEQVGWLRTVRASVSQGLRDAVQLWYWRTYNWRR